MAGACGPVLLVGCGRLGSALAQGWLGQAVLAPPDLTLQTRTETPAVRDLLDAGVRAAPDHGPLPQATVVLAVKPAVWREVAAGLAPRLRPDAVILSVMAGVGAQALGEAFPGHPVGRVMPVTAVAIGRGTAAIHAAAPQALDVARMLFRPVATVVEVEDEALMDAVTAVSGSAPAYVYAFVEALAAAGVTAGLPLEISRALARGAAVAAGVVLGEDDTPTTALIGRIASPGGTTEAALRVLTDEPGLSRLLEDAVAAAVKRAGELGR